MFKNIQKKKTALNLFRNPPSRTVLIWLLTDPLELILSKSILSLISLVYFSVQLCPGQFFHPNVWLVNLFLRYSCTFLPQTHRLSLIFFLPFHGTMSQAVLPTTPLASNRSSMRFICTSLPQPHCVYKIYLLPFSAAM